MTRQPAGAAFADPQVEGQPSLRVAGAVARHAPDDRVQLHEALDRDVELRQRPRSGLRDAKLGGVGLIPRALITSWLRAPNGAGRR